MGLCTATRRPAPGSQFNTRIANPALEQSSRCPNQRPGIATLLYHWRCLRGPSKQVRQQLLPSTVCPTLRFRRLNHDHSRVLGHNRVCEQGGTFAGWHAQGHPCKYGQLQPVCALAWNGTVLSAIHPNTG
jgi:hypothetical protein